MASQVLSGNGNVSYTNNTGQNVRVIINFMVGKSVASYYELTIAWGDGSAAASSNDLLAIGKNIACGTVLFDPAGTTRFGGMSQSNAAVYNIIAGSSIGVSHSSALPTELMLAPNQIFSAICSSYNIVVIPENG